MRYRPPREKPQVGGGGAGSGLRVKAPKIVVKETEEEEEEEEEGETEEVELSEEAVQEKLDAIGKCVANFDWNRGYYPDNACDHCSNPVYNGYNCSGGSHFVCLTCVNTA
jgi:formylmethanofuran dehydrogenase subunit E